MYNKNISLIINALHCIFSHIETVEIEWLANRSYARVLLALGCISGWAVAVQIRSYSSNLGDRISGEKICDDNMRKIH